jgi:hypothetical protein
MEGNPLAAAEYLDEVALPDPEGLHASAPGDLLEHSECLLGVPTNGWSLAACAHLWRSWQKRDRPRAVLLGSESRCKFALIEMLSVSPSGSARQSARGDLLATMELRERHHSEGASAATPLSVAPAHVH